VVGGFERVMNKSSKRAILIGVILLLLAYSAYNCLSIVHMVRTRHVSRDLYAVVDQVDNQPASIQRASDFVQKLHTINTDYAPGEVKQVLGDYTVTCEQALAAWKATGDSHAYHEKIREQSSRLKTTLKKYE